MNKLQTVMHSQRDQEDEACEEPGNEWPTESWDTNTHEKKLVSLMNSFSEVLGLPYNIQSHFDDILFVK